MIKRIATLVLAMMIVFAAQAQKKKKGSTPVLDSNSVQMIRVYQDTLIAYMNAFREERDDLYRLNACHKFIPYLVKALRVENSYHFKFDSLKNISILYAPDDAFRIFSWQVEFGSSEMRYYAVLQYNTPQLKIVPFYDASYEIKNKDTITDPSKWLGAVYYNIVANPIKGAKQYTVFGWKGNNVFSISKVAEIFNIQADSSIVLGAPVFYIIDSTNMQQEIKNRFLLEFKRSASVTLNYDQDQKMIVYDHVVDESSPELKRGYACIPDGTYEGFKWKKGKWLHHNKVFYTVMEVPFFSTPIFTEKDPATQPKMK